MNEAIFKNNTGKRYEVKADHYYTPKEYFVWDHQTRQSEELPSPNRYSTPDKGTADSLCDWLNLQFSLKVFFCHNNKDNSDKWVWSVIKLETKEWLTSKDTQDEAWNFCYANNYIVIGSKLIDEF